MNAVDFSFIINEMLTFLITGEIRKPKTKIDMYYSSHRLYEWEDKSRHIAEYLSNISNLGIDETKLELIWLPVVQLEKNLKKALDNCVEGVDVKRKYKWDPVKDIDRKIINASALFYDAQSDYYSSTITHHINNAINDVKYHLNEISTNPILMDKAVKRNVEEYNHYVNCHLRYELCEKIRFLLEVRLRKNEPEFKRRFFVNSKNAKPTLAILSYFCDEVRRRYPKQNVWFVIVQDKNILTLTLRTPEGQYDFLKKDLRDFESVYKGEVPVSYFFKNEEDYQIVTGLLRVLDKVSSTLDNNSQSLRLLSSNINNQSNQLFRANELLLELADKQNDNHKDLIIEVATLVQTQSKHDFQIAMSKINEIKGSNKEVGNKVQDIVCNSLASTIGSVAAGPLAPLFSSLSS